MLNCPHLLEPCPSGLWCYLGNISWYNDIMEDLRHMEQNCRFDPCGFRDQREDSTIYTKYGVYAIKSPSDKFYVGVTSVSFSERWKQHEKMLESLTHHCKGLQNASITYGLDRLSFFELEGFSDSEMNKRELFLLESLWWDEISEAGFKLYNSRPTESGSIIKRNAERDESIVEAYLNSSLTLQGIAENHNVSRQAVSAALRRSGIVPLGQRRRTSQKLTKDVLIKLLAQKITIVEIAKILGLSKRTILSYKKTWNL